MPTLSTSFVFFWPSTVASIPANTTRYTAWDGRYPKVAAANADAGATGGALTHPHDCSCPAHIFSSPHYHNFGGSSPAGTNYGNPLGTGKAASPTHTHPNALSNSAYTTMLANNSFASGSANNEPPYWEGIFLQSDGTLTGIPNGGVGYTDQSTLPTNWTLQAVNRMLKGAATSGDGGATGGADSHPHTLVHNQPVVQHPHAAQNSQGNSGSVSIAGALNLCSPAHYNSVTLNNQSAGNVNNCASFNSSSDNDEPPWKKLAIIKNETGVIDLPTKLIIWWIGANADIPTANGWARHMAEDDKFPKGWANTGDYIGDTGGADVHYHLDNNGTHTHDYIHLHPSTAGGNSGTGIGQTPGSTNAKAASHTMTWTVTNASETSDADQFVTINNCSSKANYPLFGEGILVQYTAPVGGAPQRSLTGIGI